MTMSVMNQMLGPGPQFFYSEEWRLLIETHLSWLRTRTVSDSVVIDHQLAYKYEGDLFGALVEQGIPEYLHYAIMRMNGLVSPVDFPAEPVVLMVPVRETITQLASLAQTRQRKIA